MILPIFHDFQRFSPLSSTIIINRRGGKQEKDQKTRKLMKISLARTLSREKIP